jgi:nucleotide sugar dehydrogenase
MNEKISVVGIGKLGLCFALTLEESGYDVLGVDLIQDYVDSINKRTYRTSEPGVVDKLKLAKNFKASVSLVDAINHSDVIFIVVSTPSLDSGRYDHSQVDRICNSIVSLGKQERTKHLVICCTVMPNYTDSLYEKVKEYNYTVSYNPEFIAQGTILRDQKYPDMVLIGEGSKEAGDILEEIYKKHTEGNPTICRMKPIEAEITKISLNCFLTTKIAFANMIGDIAIASDASPDKILHAIGSDSRVNHKYLKYGFGFGGPCFPRDNRALGIYAKDIGCSAEISDATDISNYKHLLEQVEMFDNCNKHRKNEVYTIDGVSYKRGSTILEESQQLKYAVEIAKLGYSIKIKDCLDVVEAVKATYGKLFTYEVVKDS